MASRKKASGLLICFLSSMLPRYKVFLPALQQCSLHPAAQTGHVWDRSDGNAQFRDHTDAMRQHATHQ